MPTQTVRDQFERLLKGLKIGLNSNNPDYYKFNYDSIQSRAITAILQYLSGLSNYPQIIDEKPFLCEIYTSCDRVAVGTYEWTVDVGTPITWMEMENPLEKLDDEGFLRLDDSTTKIQVAIQKNRVVVVHLPTFKKMNFKSRAGLILHESLIALLTNFRGFGSSDVTDTSSIRHLIKTLDAFADNKVPVQTLFEAIKGAGLFNLSNLAIYHPANEPSVRIIYQ